MRALAARRPASLFWGKRGRSSVVEHQLPKLSVVGSIPIARSKPTLLRSFGWRANTRARDCNVGFPARNLPLIFLFDRPRHTG